MRRRSLVPLPDLALVAALAAAGATCQETAGQDGRAPAAEPLFADMGPEAGLGGVVGGRVSFADLDRDGWPDLIVESTTVLRNVTASAGAAAGAGRRFVPFPGGLAPDAVTGTSCVQVGDADGDGAPDLFFGRMGGKEPNELWLGDGRGGFARKRDALVGLTGDVTISACFVDVDQDGVLDLFVGNSYVEYGKSLEAFPDRLFRGLGDGRFEDVTERAGLLGCAEPGRPRSRRPTYGVAHTDWNDDGRQDLLVMTYGRQANRLWRNDGGLRFTDVAPETTFDGDADRSGKYPEKVKRDSGRADEPPFRSHGNTFDCAVADWDGDGDMDCFLAEIRHWWAGPSSDASMPLENLGAAGGYKFKRRPKMIRRDHAAEAWNEGDRHAGWIDVDNDGRLDLLLASSDYPDDQLLRLWRQTEAGAFEEWTPRLGARVRNASQISLADFDRDGATDIAVATINARLTAEQRAGRDLSVALLRNLAAARAGNGFLALRLEGRGPGGANRDAVGARVTIWIGGRRQTREVYGGLGHAGHHDDAEVRFGVGKAAKVDRLEVRWPDAKGTVQRFEDVPTRRFYRLREGESLAEGL